MTNFTLLAGFLFVVFQTINIITNAVFSRSLFNYKRALLSALLVSVIFLPIHFFIFGTTAPFWYQFVLCSFMLLFLISLSVYLYYKDKQDSDGWKPAKAFFNCENGLSISDKILTIHFYNGEIRQFKYNSTWYNYPSMTETIYEFSKACFHVTRYIKEHGNDFPNAHKTKVTIPLNSLN